MAEKVSGLAERATMDGAASPELEIPNVAIISEHYETIIGRSGVGSSSSRH